MKIEYEFTFKGSFEIDGDAMEALRQGDADYIKSSLLDDCEEDFRGSYWGAEAFTVTGIDEAVAEIQEGGK